MGTTGIRATASPIQQFKEDVEKCYTELGWTPKLCNFVDPINKKCCVVAAAAIGNSDGLVTREVVDYCRKIYGFSDDFLIGIVNGFDYKPSQNDSEEYVGGYELGFELYRKYILKQE